MTERLTDEALDHGAGGRISTARFEVVRYWAGHETGDVFGRDSGYDGPTLTIEVADAADAQAMLDAIHRRATPADDLRALALQEVDALLQAENARLRAALTTLTDHWNCGHLWSGDSRHETINAVERFARAALSQNGGAA